MRKKITVFCSLVLVIALFMSNTEPKVVNTITLKYTLKYQADTWEKNRTGLLWALSMLGADLPRGVFDRNIRWVDKTTFVLNLDSLGFSVQAQEALKVVCDSIKTSDVYKKTGSVEIGHFVSLTIGSSWHYYRIVQAPPTYNDFLKQHNFAATEIFPVVHSEVSKYQRFLRSNFTGNIAHTAFIAEEGHGRVTDNSFVAKEFNVMDVMKNGQLRFMVYDSTGALLASADAHFGASGKPAKCLWCHEINIQTLFVPTDSVPGWMGPVTFDRNTKRKNELLKQYRQTLQSDVDFNQLQDHAQMELIYINYMEPSLEKLSQEWNVPVSKLEKILRTYKPHIYHEYPFLGNLYYRDSIYPVSVYKHGKIPASIREQNNREPNFFSSK